MSTLIVIACGAEKGAHAAPAGELYTSATFRHFRDAAVLEAADTVRVCGGEVRVAILSAAYGLVELDTVLAPYDVKMGDRGCVGAHEVAQQLEAMGVTTVMSMLPGAYWRTLHRAVELVNDDEVNAWVELLDVFEAPFGPRGGIGFQRGVASSLNRTHGMIAA